MASQPTTNLETHPVNTAGLNGIINGNWERLEAIFLPLMAAVNGSTIAWNSSSKVFTVRAALASITYVASPALNLAGAATQTITLTGNATFTTSNRTAGADLQVVIAADATARNLTWPAGWKWIGGAAPTSIAASKTGVLQLISTTTADTGMIARWTVEP
jgi:hypothetical protein